MVTCPTRRTKSRTRLIGGLPMLVAKISIPTQAKNMLQFVSTLPPGAGRPRRADDRLRASYSPVPARTGRSARMAISVV